MPRIRRPLIALIALILALLIGYGIHAARAHGTSAPASSGSSAQVVSGAGSRWQPLLSSGG